MVVACTVCGGNGLNRVGETFVDSPCKLCEGTGTTEVADTCTNCGHIEGHHETREYRGDKSRRCLFARDFAKGIRCNCSGFTTASKTVDVTVDDVKQLIEYVQWFGGVHSDTCPQDDTCDCFGKPINDAVNRICRAGDQE